MNKLLPETAFPYSDPLPRKVAQANLALQSLLTPPVMYIQLATDTSSLRTYCSPSTVECKNTHPPWILDGRKGEGLPIPSRSPEQKAVVLFIYFFKVIGLQMSSVYR